MTLQSEVVLGSAASGPIQLQQEYGYDIVAYVCAVVFTLCLILYMCRPGRPRQSSWTACLIPSSMHHWIRCCTEFYYCMVFQNFSVVWQWLYFYANALLNSCMHSHIWYLCPKGKRFLNKLLLLFFFVLMVPGANCCYPNGPVRYNQGKRMVPDDQVAGHFFLWLALGPREEGRRPILIMRQFAARRPLGFQGAQSPP